MTTPIPAPAASALAPDAEPPVNGDAIRAVLAGKALAPYYLSRSFIPSEPEVVRCNGRCAVGELLAAAGVPDAALARLDADASGFGWGSGALAEVVFETFGETLRERYGLTCASQLEAIMDAVDLAESDEARAADVLETIATLESEVF